MGRFECRGWSRAGQGSLYPDKQLCSSTAATRRLRTTEALSRSSGLHRAAWNSLITDPCFTAEAQQARRAANTCAPTAPRRGLCVLQVGADRRLLADPTIQRLQLGLLWFALLAVVLHLVHLLFVKTLTLWGLLIGGWLGGWTVGCLHSQTPGWLAGWLFARLVMCLLAGRQAGSIFGLVQARKGSSAWDSWAAGRARQPVCALSCRC